MTNAFSEVFAAQPADALSSLRQEAFAAFEQVGLPTTQREGWRYTSVEGLNKRTFVRPSPASIPADIWRLDSAIRIDMVDGRRVGDAPEGLRLSGLQESFLRAKAASPDDAFLALNTALFEEGLQIRCDKPVATPVHLVHYASPVADSSRHPRVVIVLESGASLTLVESYVGGASSLTNSVYDIVLMPGATLKHVRIQDEAHQSQFVSTIRATVNSKADYDFFTVNLGASLSRTEINTELASPEASLKLRGISLADGKRHCDITTRIVHAAPHCQSGEFFKGIFDDQATGVFNGIVVVAPDAQKTDAKQQNRNLLLSEKAQAYTRPQLEIYADDVKCAHGATVGQLDDEQLFYMQTRGLSLDEARRELTFAFANELLADMSMPRVAEHLEKRIRSTLTRSS